MVLRDVARRLLSAAAVTEAPDLAELAATLERVRGIAHEAGELLLGGFRRGTAVREKARSDLVTEHDEKCERLVRARLTAAFPRHGIVGEEGEAERVDAELVWYVDPIDGTSNFAHGHPFFCLAIGLAHRTQAGERPLLGVVLGPAMGLEWSGGRGLGVLRRVGGETAGERVRVSGTARLRDALCATGFPASRATSPDNNYPAFLAMDAASHGVRRCGAAAMELCLVADGAYDAFWDLGLKPWDVCAGTALVEEAGGQVTDFAGRPATLTGGRIVASNGRVHAEILSGLSARLPLPPLTLPGESGLKTGSGVG